MSPRSSRRCPAPGKTRSREAARCQAGKPDVRCAPLGRRLDSAGHSPSVTITLRRPVFTYMARISTLHRLLDMAPGNAPERLCARNSCMGLDLLSLAEVAPVVSAFALGRLCGPFGVLVALVPLIPLLWLCEQFRLFERRGLRSMPAR